MFMPLFTSFLLFVLVIRYAIKRGDDRKRSADAEFWRREREANFVRKKNLDSLDYIRVPLERLPFGALPGNAIVENAEKTVRALAEKRILNLTGLSNTDVKLAYGTANLPVLTEYDQNYMDLVTSLQAWAGELYAESLFEQALSILDYAIGIKTDVSHTWHLYIDCIRFHAGYDTEESRSVLKSRLPVAESLTSLSRDGIVKELREAIGEP